MRPSVSAAWPAMCRYYEGVTTWMYLDTKGLVTTGVGFLINTVGEAQSLPWLTKRNQPATQDEIKKEWTRVHLLQSWKKYNGLNYRWQNSAQLKLPIATVDEKLLETTKSFWDQVAKDIPNLNKAPADAQLAIMDEAWQNGKYFLKAGTAWKGTRAAVLSENWAAAANHVPGNDGSERKAARKRLFNNAWTVKQKGIDPDILWDKKKPVESSTPLPLPTPPAPTTPVEPPKEADVKYSKQWDSDYVVFRGGKFPPQTVEKLKALPHFVGVLQGGLSHAAPSANTHAGLGVGDESVRGYDKDEVWQHCQDEWEVNILPAPRGFVKDSFQGKTVTDINDGNEHIHWLDLDEVKHMHPEAQAQVKEMLTGGDGLRGNAHFTGPGPEYRTEWKDSMYNPKNVKAEGGVLYVQVDDLVGNDRLRKRKKLRELNYKLTYVKQVKRWGRWNAVTASGTFYAIEVDGKKYLAPEKVVVADGNA